MLKAQCLRFISNVKDINVNSLYKCNNVNKWQYFLITFVPQLWKQFPYQKIISQENLKKKQKGLQVVELKTYATRM